MASASEENYLKALYALSIGDADHVSTNALAEKLQTKASSCTDMIKKLHEKGWVHYKKYQGAKLTAEGEKIALSTIRKHRIWETFLVEKLGYGWGEVHEIAEQLEHVKAPELIDRLSAHMGHPQFDPHGSPIPTSDGKINLHEDKVLATAPAGSKAIIRGIKDSSPSLLKHLDSMNISIGSKLEVLSFTEFDRSMKIAIDSREHLISAAVSENLYID